MHFLSEHDRIQLRVQHKQERDKRLCDRIKAILLYNASYYRNKAVRECLTNSKVELHFLPPYSPHLNPIERLWKWMKESVIYNAYYEHFAEFKTAVIGFLTTLPRLAAGSELG